MAENNVTIEEIQEAIKLLDKGESADFMADGVTPKVEAIEEILGRDITAGQRDEAWAALAADEAAPAADLVKMVRERDEGEVGPTTADVHPDEVKNYQAGGWRVEG